MNPHSLESAVLALRAAAWSIETIAAKAGVSADWVRAIIEREIGHLRNEGLPHTAAALAAGRHVRGSPYGSIGRQHDIRAVAPPPLALGKRVRNVALVERYLETLPSLQVLAEEFGITRERVRQVLIAEERRLRLLGDAAAADRIREARKDAKQNNRVIAASRRRHGAPTAKEASQEEVPLPKARRPLRG